MGLHVEFYVLDGMAELDQRRVTPMVVLPVNEHMGLNRLLTDVGIMFGKDQRGVTPVIESLPVPEGFGLARGGEETALDGYGEVLRYTYAGQLAKIKIEDPEPATSPSDRRAQAALAYLAQLPPSTPVVLYWI